jgi:DNA polymerase-3 subunit epsilon
LSTQFDMFSNDLTLTEASSTDRRKPPIGRDITEAEMVAHLTASGRYRILQKLKPRRIAADIRPEFPLRGVIVDTETTGLNHRQEEIIEIGLVAFTFDQQGMIGDVTTVYGGLQ